MVTWVGIMMPISGDASMCHWPVRTTITLTPEAESLVRAAMSEDGRSFKETINTAIIRALTPARRQRVDTPTYRIGLASIPGHRALALAGELEDEELARRRQLGK
jgi:hypothetical protein